MKKNKTLLKKLSYGALQTYPARHNFYGIMFGSLKGNIVYLALICDSEDELKDYFNKISEGGKVEQPLTKPFFGWFGSLEDKFGKHWMLQG